MANILIIDDDLLLADDLKFIIEDEGHKCVVYKRADEVMSNLERLGKFDIILLDIMMLKGSMMEDDHPDVETGEILYKEIRKKYPAKKIVIISAMDFRKISIDFRQEDNVEILQKPLTETKLRDLLKMIS